MIGALKDRIKVIAPKRIDNGRGGWTTDYSSGDYMEIWAAASLISMALKLKYQEFNYDADMSFIIRENPFVNGDCRIYYRGKAFDIQDTRPASKTGFFVILAKEV